MHVRAAKLGRSLGTTKQAQQQQKRHAADQGENQAGGAGEDGSSAPRLCLRVIYGCATMTKSLYRVTSASHYPARARKLLRLTLGLVVVRLRCGSGGGGLLADPLTSRLHARLAIHLDNPATKDISQPAGTIVCVTRNSNSTCQPEVFCMSVVC